MQYKKVVLKINEILMVHNGSQML